MTSREGKADAAHGGLGWIPRSRKSVEEIGVLWGACGQDSEYGKLRRVAMHRPGKEMSGIHDASKVHWNELVVLEKAQQQFDALCEIYARYDVDVMELNVPHASPNLIFMRDLFVMTPAGAILSRPASDVRAGEEVVVSAFLAEHKIPILMTVSGDGVFEGPDVVFFDRRCVFLGTGIRTNDEGARQVRFALELQGIEVIPVQTTYGCGHLDGVLSVVGPKKAILYPTRVSYKVYETLQQRGYDIIPLPDGDEAEQHMAINTVALEPNLVLISEGTPKTQKILREHGVTSIPVDLSELMKAGGAMHCLTGIIQRDMLPQ